MSFKLKKIQIEKFRNIRSNVTKTFELDFKPGINVISGHNGVGKSNILSIVSSATGIGTSDVPSGNNFQPEFYEYFKIGKHEEFKEYEIFSLYEDAQENYVTKELRFKDDTNFGRGIRIIPTTSNKLTSYSTLAEAKKEIKKQLDIGPEARIKVPTRYISISRLFPLGESDLSHSEVYKSSKYIKNDYNILFREYYNSVLNDSILEDAKMYISKKSEVKNPIIALEIQNTNRNSKSVGQDSLDTIISSIVDFEYLKNNTENYIGGILCIDEIDISFHPNAQIKLISLLEKISEKLNLQIFITTHSLTIINEISKKIEKSKKNQKESRHSINYIKDKKMPFITQKNDYSSIKADMFSERHLVDTKTKFYFEDQIAIDLHINFMDVAQKILSSYTYKPTDYTYIDAKTGKSNLRHLNKVDKSYFGTVGIILDGDSRFSDQKPVNVSDVIQNGIKKIPEYKDEFNVLILPYVLPPEAYLYMIFSHYVNLKSPNECQEFWITMDEISELSETREYFVENNFLLDETSITNDIIKKHSKLGEITDFIFNNNVLEFYYKYDEERKKELLDYVNGFEKLTTILKNKANSAKR